jgi:hypothetical protein
MEAIFILAKKTSPKDPEKKPQTIVEVFVPGDARDFTTGGALVSCWEDISMYEKMRNRKFGDKLTLDIYPSDRGAGFQYRLKV